MKTLVHYYMLLGNDATAPPPWHPVYKADPNGGKLLGHLSPEGFRPAVDGKTLDMGLVTTALPILARHMALNDRVNVPFVHRVLLVEDRDSPGTFAVMHAGKDAPDLSSMEYQFAP